MAVPKKRTSSSRRDMRRAHDALTPVFGIVCPSCGEAMLRHRACPSCGEYRGKQIVKTVTDEEEKKPLMPPLRKKRN